MKNWLKLNLPKTWYYTAFLFVLFPFLPLNFSSFFLILLLFFSLLSFFFVEKPSLKTIPIPIALLMGYMLLLFGFAPFSSNIGEAFFDFQKKLGLLLIPLSFYFIHGTLVPNLKKQVLTFYTISTVLFSVYILLRLAIFGVNPNYEIAGLEVAVRISIEDFTHVHPTYMAAIIAFAILIILADLKKIAIRSWIFWLQLLALSILLFTLFTLGSRMPIIGLVVSSVYVFYKNFKWRGLLAACGFLLLLSVGALYNPVTANRIAELLHTGTDRPTLEAANATNTRNAIYNCDWEISKKNWLLGVGAGDIQKTLNKCYALYQNRNLMRNYNTHNEYFNTWLSTGIFGLLLFLSIIGVGIYKKRQDVLSTAFLLLTSILFVSENILSRQIGVFFFAFFMALLFFRLPEKQDE